MTFGVPYSFVPGTKAKADEVNANFIDVLTKIENTNLRIDETNSNADSINAEVDAKFEEVENSIAQCADLDFSNISSTAQAKFDAKANTSDIDGRWTVVSGGDITTTSTTLSNSSATSFSLTSFLTSSNVYEVVLSLEGVSSGKGWFTFNAGFNSLNAIWDNDTNFGRVVTIPVSTARKLTITPSSLASGTTKCAIRLRAYRKVR